MSQSTNQRLNRLSFSNQYNQNEEEEDEMQNEAEWQQQNFYKNDFGYNGQQKRYSNEEQIKQNINYNEYDDQEYENEEEQAEERQSQYFRYNNYDAFENQGNDQAKRTPLQMQQQHQVKAINYQKQNNYTRSKSPSISHLPDFLRNQAERSGSQMKRESETTQMKQQRQNERCQQLYELGEKKRISLIQKKHDSDQIKENDSQCTFRPLSYTKKSMYRVQTQSTLNIFERTNIWNEQKKQKLDSIKQTDKNKDLEGCTFQPQIKSSQQSHLVNMSIYPSQNGIGLKGVDKFLRRQILARRAKEELEAQKENPFCHVENKNTCRNIETIPMATLTKKTKLVEHIQPAVDNQNYDKAIRNLRQELLNMQL